LAPRLALTLVLLAVAAAATAEMCVSDVVPAATLLAPYVVVDMDGNVPSGSGMTTILSVTNTGADAVLVRLTLWTADGTEVLILPEALSGYDMWTIDFSDLLSGHWSAFATSVFTSAPPNRDVPPELYRRPFEWGPDGRSASSSGSATPSWVSGLSEPGTTSAFPMDCQMVTDVGDSNGSIFAPIVVTALQAPLFARTHAGAGWGLYHEWGWLTTLTADPLFFYATLDVVATCSVAATSDPAYFQTEARTSNVLLGDLTYEDRGAGTLAVIPAVHIEASPTGLVNSQPVLGPFEAALGHEDFREPLPTAFAVRYHFDPQGQAGRAGTTDLMLWKTVTELTPAGQVDDHGSFLYYAWDDDEHVMTTGCSCGPYGCLPGPACGATDANVLPFATQLIPLDPSNFNVVDRTGWLMLVLPPSYGTWTDPTPEAGGPGYTRYMGVAATASASLVSGHWTQTWTPAAVLGNAHCPGGASGPLLARPTGARP
jgi:hypothetical protein